MESTHELEQEATTQPKGKGKRRTAERLPKQSRSSLGTLPAVKIRVSPATYTAVTEYAKVYGMNIDTVVWQLVEFYRLENLQLLIKQLHAKYLSGLTVSELNQLSILYTLLGEIDRLSGL